MRNWLGAGVLLLYATVHGVESDCNDVHYCYSVSDLWPCASVCNKMQLWTKVQMSLLHMSCVRTTDHRIKMNGPQQQVASIKLHFISEDRDGHNMATTFHITYKRIVAHTIFQCEAVLKHTKLDCKQCGSKP